MLSLRTFFFILAYVAMVLASYQILPDFPRMKEPFSEWLFTACWGVATLGTLIPVAFKQRPFSDRFWHVFVVTSIVGTCTGFTSLYLLFEYATRRNGNFPGIGAFIFFIGAAILAGAISFVLGWCIPRHPRSTK